MRTYFTLAVLASSAFALNLTPAGDLSASTSALTQVDGQYLTLSAGDAALAHEATLTMG